MNRAPAASHTWVTEPHEPGMWTERTEQRRRHPFRATWSDTLDLMDRELAWIGATGRVVLQLDIVRGRVRRDGLPQANVTVDFPGVAISFESERGPLTYRVDTYEGAGYQALSDWQANFRAVALTLEALRAVSRHGGAELGQQYTGWLALPGGASGPFTSTAEAQFWLEEAAKAYGIEAGDWPAIAKRLAAKLHPDTSTLPAEDREEQWVKLQAARKILAL